MGRKQNPLPDHRTKVYGGTHYRPTEEEVSDLARQYGFKPDYPLREALECAYIKEETNRHIAENTPTPGKQKKQLQVLRDRCEEVKEVVSKLGSSDRILLDQVFGETLNMQKFEKDVFRVYSASRIALDGLKNQRGRRQINTNIWNFILHLADIWKEGTGNEPTAAHSDIDNKYIGDFYDFVLQCATIGNVRLSKANPGAIIVKILIEWRQR